MKFSVMLLHFGEKHLLETAVENWSEVSDDINILHLNTEDDYRQQDNIIVKPWNWIIKHGFSAAWNLLSHTGKYDFAYLGAVTKKIIHIDHTALTGEHSSYACRYGDRPQTWYKLNNVHKTVWCGRIHEEIKVLDGGVCDNRDAIVWDRTKNKVVDHYKHFCAQVLKKYMYLYWQRKIQTQTEHRFGTNSAWYDGHLKIPQHQEREIDEFLETMNECTSLNDFRLTCEKLYQKQKLPKLIRGY